jgi:hypothetical protein
MTCDLSLSESAVANVPTERARASDERVVSVALSLGSAQSMIRRYESLLLFWSGRWRRRLNHPFNLPLPGVLRSIFSNADNHIRVSARLQ